MKNYLQLDRKIYQRKLALIHIAVFSLTFLGASQQNAIPDNYTLSQNYPNPFNPTTKISYAIPKESFVKLKIYNMLGNEIATLINEDQEAGFYSIRFDASDIPSGIYFYRLQANDYTLTKKLTVLK